MAWRAEDSEHTGYTYHSDNLEAVKNWQQAKKDCGELYFDEIEIFDLPLKKENVLNFLNTYCGYPDNG